MFFVDRVNVGKLKAVPFDFKQLDGVVSKEVVKKAVYNELNLKVNRLEKKIIDASTLIQANQHNFDK